MLTISFRLLYFCISTNIQMRPLTFHACYYCVWNSQSCNIWNMVKTYWPNLSYSSLTPYSSLFPLHGWSSTLLQQFALSSMLVKSIRKWLVWHSKPGALCFPDPPCPGPALYQQNINRSRGNIQSSQTLRVTSPVLLSTSRCSHTPLELKTVISDLAPAFSSAPDSSCSYGGAFKMLQDVTYWIFTFWCC